MGVFDVNYDIVVRHRTPVRLRKAKRLAWLRVLVSGIKWVFENRFIPFRADRLYYLTHNSQVCYMEGALNDTFDPIDRLIYIDDGPFLDPVYIYLDAEEKIVFLAKDSELPVIDYDAPVWLFSDLEISETGWQFIVYYPEGMVFDLDRMKALINKYRLPSKRVYGIVPYTP